MQSLLPKRLQFCKSFFTQVPCIAPTITELMQCSQMCAPIRILDIGFTPSLDLFNEGQALDAVLSGIVFDFFQPSLHHLVGVVAGIVKTFPKRVIGQATLVCLFPLFAQLTQGILHLASAHGRFENKFFFFAFGSKRHLFKQALRLQNQGQSTLVGHITLPARGITRRNQGFMHLQIHGGVHVAALFFQSLPQGF